MRYIGGGKSKPETIAYVNTARQHTANNFEFKDNPAASLKRPNSPPPLEGNCFNVYSTNLRN